MADTGQVFDTKFWGADRHISLLGYIKEIRRERRAIRDVRHDEKYYKKIMNNVEKHKIKVESEEFEKLKKSIADTNKAMPGVIIDLIKMFGHSIAISVALERKLKEAEKEHNIPEELAQKQLRALEVLHADALAEMDTIMKMANTLTKQ